MGRNAKQFDDPVKQRRHERQLEKRRRRHRERKALEAAERAAGMAADGDVDMEALLEHERERFSAKKAQFKEMGKKSPKIMSQARQDLADAFDLMGGVPALVLWGKQHPTDFYRLWAKLIPATAQKESDALPLEQLLSELASREEMSVREAAQDIGTSLLEKGRKGAEAEDAAGLRPEEIN